jgi:hypothetical protein
LLALADPQRLRFAAVCGGFEHDGSEYVVASDRDFGLYIFEYTGP